MVGFQTVFKEKEIMPDKSKENEEPKVMVLRVMRVAEILAQADNED